MKSFVIFISLLTLVKLQCPPPSERVDCHPEEGATNENCLARGCCYDNTKMSQPSQPSCFFPTNYGGYAVTNITQTDDGFLFFMSRTFPSAYPNDVPLLRVDVEFQTNSILRVKISDPSQRRYEAPYPKIVKQGADNSNPQYFVVFTTNSTGFQVWRQTGGSPLFDSQKVGAFIYSDQFLQISTPIFGRLFGIGESRTNLTIKPEWHRFTLFNHDGIPQEDTNLYGSHPFYMVVDDNGTAHGVFLHNSNSMDILTSPQPSVTFRTIGGILDFYFFLGPTPDDVVKQYTSIVGRTLLPPYWSLGFHLCRYGYGSANNTRAVWQRNRELQIPYDVQWNDIDYMITQNDFTVNPETYGNLGELVDDIHNYGMHYVPIIDPGVSASEPKGTYAPFDLGLELDVFVKDENNDVFIGKVWNPVSTAFPDFTHPNAQAYWGKLMADFHDVVPFDGVWIDMNEPSNFIDGSVNGCPDNNLENPQYRTGVLGDKLNYRTLCMSAKHAAGLHYDVHNLYSIAEAEVTFNSLLELGKRPFVISRSTYSGSGRYTGHWSGDNDSSWSDLRKSIQELLTFNVYGVSFMGADICGFRGNTNQKLCNRWFQLGAFYTFSRNHNDQGNEPQDPSAFDEPTINSIRKALTQRYTLLPYLYTLFYESHTEGSTVARPLFFEFPRDNRAYEVELSFLWGRGLYIIPVLDEDAYEVTTYLPFGRWYDWYTGSSIDVSGDYVTFDAPYDTIPLLIRGGSVIPTQLPATTTTESRNNGIVLVAGLDDIGEAEGRMYWDDGEVIDPVENNLYGLLEFSVRNNQLSSVVTVWNSSHTPNLERIKVLGVMSANKVLVNNASAEFTLRNEVLSITELRVPLSTPIIVTWS